MKINYRVAFALIAWFGAMAFVWIASKCIDAGNYGDAVGSGFIGWFLARLVVGYILK